MAIRKTVFSFNDEEEKTPDMNNRVVKNKECCLTCGGNKRLQWIERVDGKRVIKEACLYCLTACHTTGNEVDH